MQVTFQRALGNLPDDDFKEDRIGAAIFSISAVSVSLANAAFEHLQEFGVDVKYGDFDTISINKAQESEWHGHIDQVMAALLYAIQLSHEVGANDEIKGTLYESFFNVSGLVLNDLALSHPDFAVQKAFTKSPQELKTVVEEVLTDILEDAQRIKPELKDPRVQAAENKKLCYVATEVFGDPSHRDVNTLREFRARVLYKFELGRVFCRWYEENGSGIAKKVGSHIYISSLVKAVLVSLAWLFRHLLR